MPGDALSRIRARGHIGIRLGLERMQALLAELGDPQAALRGVLVAGTNGKGSVAAMVASMLRAGGYRTSQAPSPHLSSYRERIIIDGEPIAMHLLQDLLDEVLHASEPGEAQHGPATEFELLIAAAFLCSARERVDVAVMEVGLGGRLDATNTWDAPVAAITNVGLDHQAFLGHRVELVAAEKAAIIKPGGRAVTGATGAALAVVADRARHVDAPLLVRGPLPIERSDRSGAWLRDPSLGVLHVPLLGGHQAANASVALGIVEALEAAGVARLDEDEIRLGLARTSWPGRMELIDHDGTAVLLDGAHNPDGAHALAQTVDELRSSLPDGPVTLLVGILADKDVEAVMERLRGSSALATAHLVATRVPESDRSLGAAELVQAWRSTPRASEVPVRAADAVDDADEALEHALRTARQAGGPLVVSGSLYLVGHVRSRLLPRDERA